MPAFNENLSASLTSNQQEQTVSRKLDLIENRKTLSQTIEKNNTDISRLQEDIELAKMTEPEKVATLQKVLSSIVAENAKLDTELAAINQELDVITQEQERRYLVQSESQVNTVPGASAWNHVEQGRNSSGSTYNPDPSKAEPDPFAFEGKQRIGNY
jgi:ABC-type phosphate transport system auxiliary subunit